ncbi:hypothetical protein GCM10008940_12890 [Microbulbifer agarilyticus]
MPGPVCETFTAMDGGAEPPGMGTRRVSQTGPGTWSATELANHHPATLRHLSDKLRMLN